MRPAPYALATLLAASAAFAEENASAAETAAVLAAIGKLGCTATEVEKESDDLFELDDAACAIGQYDIKLDGKMTILSMTFDGPVDAGAPEVEASDAEAAMVAAAIAPFGCKADEIEKESDALFELDDAACTTGQFDIKVDGAGVVVSMTYDGDIDADDAAALPEGAMAKIDALLAEMKCELNGEIEAEDGGFELDDVFCADGQYDVKLDADFKVVEKRKE